MPYLKSLPSLNLNDQQIEKPSKTSAFDNYVSKLPPATPVNEEQGGFGDLVDKFQEGFYATTGSTMTGVRGMLTDTQEPWDIEQSQYDAAARQQDTLSTAQKEADAKMGFGEGKELNLKNVSGLVAGGLGSLLPSAIGGGIPGAILKKGATLLAPAAVTAQKVAQGVGYAAGGAVQIGGATKNQVEQEIGRMSPDNLIMMPDFKALVDSGISFEEARKQFAYSQSQTGLTQGGILGAASMGTLGPVLERIVLGSLGKTGIQKVLGGAATEGVQEFIEEGGQQRIANPLTGKEDWEGVLEGATIGAIGGVGAGATVGAAGAMIPVQDDQGNIIGYKDQNGKPYSNLGMDNTGLPMSDITGKPDPVAQANQEKINKTMMDDVIQIAGPSEYLKGDSLFSDEVPISTGRHGALPPSTVQNPTNNKIVQDTGSLSDALNASSTSLKLKPTPPDVIEGGKDEAPLEGELMGGELATQDKTGQPELELDAIEGEFTTLQEGEQQIQQALEQGLIAPEDANNSFQYIENRRIELNGQLKEYQNRVAQQNKLDKKARPMGPFEQPSSVVGKNERGEDIYQDEEGKRFIKGVEGTGKGDNKQYEMGDFRGARFQTPDEIQDGKSEKEVKPSIDIKKSVEKENKRQEESAKNPKVIEAQKILDNLHDDATPIKNIPEGESKQAFIQGVIDAKNDNVDDTKSDPSTDIGNSYFAGTQEVLTVTKKEKSEQFNSYKTAIENLDRGISQGLSQQIKMDERLNDGEADELLKLDRQNLIDKKKKSINELSDSNLKAKLEDAKKKAKKFDEMGIKIDDDFASVPMVEAEIKKREASTENVFSDKTTIPNMDDPLNDPEYFKKNKGIVVRDKTMSPDEYIETTVKGFKSTKESVLSGRDEKLIDKYAEEMKKGDKFPMVSLDYSGGSFNQEGIHRALAAKKAGITKIPVRIREDFKKEEGTELLDKLVESFEPGAPKARLTIERFKNPKGADRIKVTGDTFALKDEIKAIGGASWARSSKVWTFPASKEDAVRKALAEYLKPATEKDAQGRTDAQKEAGNYKKIHKKWNGLDIAIENAEGTIRSGTDEDGKIWEVTMENDYGYIKRTEGADGDHVDVFMGPNLTSDKVYVVNQTNADGSFDEHKVMTGFSSKDAAEKGYLANYEQGWSNYSDIAETTVEGFKTWLKEDTQKKSAKFDTYDEFVKEKQKKILRDKVDEVKAETKSPFDEAPNLPISYVEAKKESNGKYKLYFIGTTNEVFQGEEFNSANEAKGYFKAQKIKYKAETKPKKSKEQIQANEELDDVWGEMGDFLSSKTSLKIVPDENRDEFTRILTKLISAAFKAGYYKFKDNARYILDTVREKFGDKAVENFDLQSIQGAYIAMSSGKKNTTSMTDVVQTTMDQINDPTVKDTAGISPIDKFYEELKAGTAPTDLRQMRKWMNENGMDGTDTLQIKKAQEYYEAAQVRVARDIVNEGGTRKEIYNKLVTLYKNQPILHAATSTSVANQAFSTPPPISYIASELAGINKNTTVYEPTAGNGMLLIGADPKKATVNELETLRAENLSANGFRVTNNDATTYLPQKEHDVMITNPPFGNLGRGNEVKVDGYTIRELDHVIAAKALKSIKDDGTATIIIGASKNENTRKPNDKIFFNWLYSNYNITDHFEINGDLYRRQGSGWSIAVITVNGRVDNKAMLPIAEINVKRLNTWEEIYEHSNEMVGSTKPIGQDFTGTISGQNIKTPKQPKSGSVSGQTGSKVPRPDKQGKPKSTTDGDTGSTDGGPRVRTGTVRSDGTLSESDKLGARTNEVTGGYSGATDQAEQNNNGNPDNKSVNLNEIQSDYVTGSKGFNEEIYTPSGLAEATQHALNQLKQQVGDLDNFVQSELGYKSEEDLFDAFMGLQIDGIAMTINNLKKNKGMIIADQTGVGKGRQAAAIIRWAIKNGKTPIFMTEKPNLFTDMYNDLADIGTNDVKPFILNQTEAINKKDKDENITRIFNTAPTKYNKILASKKLPPGSNVLFTTYSQIQDPGNKQQKLIENMVKNDDVIFILDESHNIGGTNSNRGKFMDSMLRATPNGALYLSATFAKRPDNMPIYFKTDLGDGTDSKDGLITAIEGGGVLMQTVVSNQLAQSGQLIRREKSFEGIEIKSVTIGADDPVETKRQQKLADGFTTILRGITSADKSFHVGFVAFLKKQVGDGKSAMYIPGTEITSLNVQSVAASVDHTGFTSVVHNKIKQLLFVAKAEEAAKLTIASLKAGRKPVIAVDDTLETFLKNYVTRNGVMKDGSLKELTFKDILQESLDRSRRLRIVLPTGDKEVIAIPLEDLDIATRQSYDRAQKLIDTMDTTGLPVSPIDMIRHKIEQAGYSVKEITGRIQGINYNDMTLMDIPESGSKKRFTTVDKFNTNKIDVIILNQAGATGLSLHSSEKLKENQRQQREMIVVQPSLDINTFMQMLGRVNRTGQVNKPIFKLLSLNIPAEIRPTAILSNKMKSLNANTSSDTKSNTSVKSADIMNKYGNEVVAEYLRENPSLRARLDVSLDSEDIVQKATGRLAILPVKRQKEFYDVIQEQYAEYIDHLNKMNRNDLEKKIVDLQAKELTTDILYPGKKPGSIFGGNAYIGEFEVQKQGFPPTANEVIDIIDTFSKGRTPSNINAEIMSEKEDQAKDYIAKLEKADSDDDGVLASVTGTKAKSRMPEFHKTKREVERELNTFSMGQVVNLKIEGESMKGVVTGVKNTHKKGATGNPFALSKTSIRFAVDNAYNSITLPLSKLIGKKSAYDSKDWRSSITSVFDKPEASVATEKRFIVTNNLLQGYSKIGTGNVVQFTKNDGTTDVGILLPHNYKQNTDEMQWPVTNVKDVLKMIEGGIKLESSLEGSSINRNADGGLSIEAGKSKTRASSVIQDEILLPLVTGNEFSKVGGGQWRGNVPPVNADRAIKRFMQLFPLTVNRKIAEKYGLVENLKADDDLSKVTKKSPVEHPDFSFTGVTKPSGLSEENILSIINDVYGRPLSGSSKFRNLNIINDKNQKWRGKFSPNTKQITLNAYYMTKEDAIRILHHEKIHQYIKVDAKLKKIGDTILAKAKKYPNSAAGKALEIAKRRVPKDAKEYDRKIYEETLAYLIQYYNKPGHSSALKELINAIRKFFANRFGMFMNEGDAVDYVAKMVKAEAKDTANEEQLYRQKMTDMMENADIEEIEYSALSDGEPDIRGKVNQGRDKDTMGEMFGKFKENFTNKMRQGAIDRYNQLFVNDKKLYGNDILASEENFSLSAWMLAKMSTSSQGAVHAMLDYGRIMLDKDGAIDRRPGKSKSITEVLKQLGSGNEVNDFMTWIAANRGERLYLEGWNPTKGPKSEYQGGRENLFTWAEIQQGKAFNKGKEQLWNKVLNEFDQFRKDVLEISQKSGIISEKQAADFANEMYVPFYRVMSEDQITTGAIPGRKDAGRLSRAEAYKKLKGGKEKIGDLLENTLLNYNHLLSASLKNNAASRALETASHKSVDVAVQVPESLAITGKATYVMKNGEKLWYNVSDKLTYNALISLTDLGMNQGLMKLMRSFKRVFTIATTASPQFITANFMRDSVHAAAIGKKTMSNNAATGFLNFNDKNRNKQRMIASGGGFSFGHVYMDDPDAIKRQIDRDFRKANLLSEPKHIGDMILKMWDNYQEISNRAENANRMAVYEQALKDGKSHQQSAFEARDLLDFSSRGEWAAIRVLTDIVPFLNARLQGLDVMTRKGIVPSIKTVMGKGTDSDKVIAKRFSIVTGAVMLASMALYMAYKDDEDFKKLEDWQRDTYWFFKIGDHQFFIPKPFEIGAMGTMAERILEQMVDNKVTGKLFAERFKEMLLNTFAFNPTPQMIKPVYDVYANRDSFTGRNIETQAMQNLSPENRIRGGTTSLAKNTSAALQSLFGGDSGATLSPVQVDFLIKNYLGWVGASASGFVDNLVNYGERPEKYWHEYQPIKRFYQSGESNYSRYTTQFYDNMKEVNRVYADIKHFADLKELDRARKLLSDNKDKLPYRKLMNRVSKKLTAANKQIIKVRRSSLSQADKRRRIDALQQYKNTLTSQFKDI